MKAEQKGSPKRAKRRSRPPSKAEEPTHDERMAELEAAIARMQVLPPPKYSAAETKRRQALIDQQPLLSPDDTRIIHRIYWGDKEEQIEASKRLRLADCEPGVFEYGQLAEAEVTQFFHWLEMSAVLRPDEDLLRRFFNELAARASLGDHHFFEQLAFLVRARKEGRTLTHIALSEMIPQHGGRKRKPYDLPNVVPMAFLEVLGYRVGLCPPDGTKRLNRKIGRWELKDEIQSFQKLMGLDSPPLISESELSRWITKEDISLFMA